MSITQNINMTTGNIKIMLTEPVTKKSVRLTAESHASAINIAKRKNVNHVRLADLVTELHLKLVELDEIAGIPDDQYLPFSVELAQDRIQASIELLIEDFHAGARTFSAPTDVDLTPVKKNDKKLH